MGIVVFFCAAVASPAAGTPAASMPPDACIEKFLNDNDKEFSRPLEILGLSCQGYRKVGRGSRSGFAGTCRAWAAAASGFPTHFPKN
jgi:hypothetical protein